MEQGGKTFFKEEIAEILTHAAFYAGWPKAWAAFRMAKEVWTEETCAESAKEAHEKSMLFSVGKPNDVSYGLLK